MAYFYYNSGAIDQIGGIVTVPPLETYLPAFQGPVYTLPAGLVVTGNRKFIWTLAEPYPGVAITNEETETPTLTFTIPPFDELLIKVRCTVKGQPQNFVDFILNTKINEAANFSLGAITINKPNGLAVVAGGITLDNSLENKAVKPTETVGDMSLYWLEPEVSINISSYRIEELLLPQRVWSQIDTTLNKSYNIPAGLNTYAITPLGNVYFQPRRFVIAANQDSLLAKSFTTFNLNAYKRAVSVMDPVTPPNFFVFNTVENEEDSAPFNLNSYKKASVLDPVEPVNFYTLAEFLNEEDSIEFNLKSYGFDGTITIVDNQPNFWTEDIGV